MSGKRKKISIKDIKLDELKNVSNETELKKVYPDAVSIQANAYKEYFEIQPDVFIRCDRFLKDGTPMRNLSEFKNDDIDWDKFEVTSIYATKNKQKHTFVDLWKK
ncbi:MAG TPA: hypothetical protein V6C58_21360 [Allocoleopsis sp.]